MNFVWLTQGIEYTRVIVVSSERLSLSTDKRVSPGAGMSVASWEPFRAGSTFSLSAVSVDKTFAGLGSAATEFEEASFTSNARFLVSFKGWDAT